MSTTPHYPQHSALLHPFPLSPHLSPHQTPRSSFASPALSAKTLHSDGFSTPTLAQTPLPAELHSYCVIGGGTGCNAVLGAFTEGKRAAFIVPVSDDGGSSSEVQRVLGGPSVGDIRSRLTRLIGDVARDSPLSRIKTLLEYRLTDKAKSSEVKAEWTAIVEGRHKLWRGIPNDIKECIRKPLVVFSSEVLMRASKGFNWKRASVGNIFISGARLMYGNLPSAIFQFASLTDIPHNRLKVVPVINTPEKVVIAAELANGSTIIGQSEISHPAPSSTSSASTGEPSRASTPSLYPPADALGGSLSTSASPSRLSRAPTPGFEAPIMGAEDLESESEPGSGSEDDEDSDENDELETRRNRNVVFSKGEVEPLESRIERIFYLNATGYEHFPRANPLFFDSLETASCLIYSPGSLYTSIIPCLALHKVGSAIVHSPTLRAKVLLLNSTHDRETASYSALDFVEAIRAACARKYVDPPHDLAAHVTDLGLHEHEQIEVKAREVVSHVVWVEGGEVDVDEDTLAALGIISVRCPSARGAGKPVFDEDTVRHALAIILGSRAD